jgi:uncharacterized OB-fold protein
MSASTHISRDPRTCAASDTSAPYWNGLADARLMLPRCDACSTVFFFPRMWCPTCWSSDISWIEATGRGTIYTYCMVNVAFDGRSPKEVPYAVALVDLDEGVRMPGRLHPLDMDAQIGMQVVLDFSPDPENSLPVWRRA